MTTTMHTYLFGCLFGGGGGMALGTQESSATFRGHEGRFVCAGGYDFDADACRVFEYLTGCPETQADATEVTREDIWRIFGRTAPHAFWCSAPCKGGSPLVSDALASTPKYVAMNMLNYVGIRTVLDAYEGNEPAYFILENVPNITSDKRGAEMVSAVMKLFKSRGYVVHHGYHEARHIGDLAQRRKRWFLVARLVRKVPVFLYRPPMKPGKVCRDVLGPMPLPGDPAGGPMNEIAGTSVMNLLRLWAIEAGEDWRSLIKDSEPEREQVNLSLPAGTFHHVDRVTDWNDATGAVTTSPAPSSGAPAVADPIQLVAASANYFNGYLGVTGWADPTRAVIVGRGNGAHGVASPVPIDLVPNDRFGDSLGVLSDDEAAGTVTARAGATTGRFSIADRRPIDLVPQAGNRRLHYGKYSLARWDGSTRTVITASRVGSGALAVAQPIDLTATAFRDGYGVLRLDQEAGTVTANARVHTGAFSVAAPPPPLPSPIDLLPRKACFDAGYAVLSPDQPSRTIAATAEVGCGAYAYAAEVPEVPARPALPQYVILTYEQTKAIVDGEVPLPFAVIDPDRPGEPLAIIESLDKAPFRWEEHVVERVSKKGKVTRKTVRKKVVVALVLISRDGTWHRPLTTLELAALQGLRWTHRDGKPLDFGGGRTCDREIIGNMVPPPVACAMASQLLLSQLVADTVGFALGDAGTPIWVKNVRKLERELKREGFVVVKGSRPMNFTTGEPLDDGALRWKSAKKKRPKKAARRVEQQVRGLEIAAHDPRPAPFVHVSAAVQ